MSKLFSISLSLIIVFQSIGITFVDIVQIDEFIEHAKFHSEEYGDNVFVFISKHYGKLKVDHEKQHQEEKEEHEQLPFQNQYVSITFFTMFLAKTEFDIFCFTKYNPNNFYYREPFSFLHSKDLFQPPRLS